MKSVKIRSYFWSVFSYIRAEYGDLRSNLRISPNAGKYGPEITPYLDTFHAVYVTRIFTSLSFLRVLHSFPILVSHVFLVFG